MEQPNFTNKRTLRKIIKVVAWCKNILRLNDTRYVSAEKLDKIFGNTSHATSRYLRKKLLIRSGYYIVDKQTFSYHLNFFGLKEIEQKLAEHNVSSEDILLQRVEEYKSKYAEELRTCNFKYKETNNRYYNGIQNANKEIKAILFADSLPFNYDIRAAGPTITYYCAILNDASEHQMSNLKNYIDNPNELRTYLQELTKLDRKIIKDIINGILYSARLVPNHNIKIFKLLKNHGVADPAAMIKFLKSDEQFSTLRKELNYAWKHILSRRSCDGKARSAFYFEKEKEIVDIAVNILESRGTRIFREHDGFRTDQEIDLKELELAIESHTNIIIKIVKDE